MKRVIKFRAWDEKGNQMIDHDDLQMNCDGFSAIDEEGTEFPMEVIMQFTGLLDKNGKEIYEGDIIKLDKESRKMYGTTEKPVRENCLVGWKDGCFMFARNDIDAYYMDSYLWLVENASIEIIGNSYENPELLNPSSPSEGII